MSALLSEFGLEDDPTQKVRSALNDAFVANFNAVCELFPQATEGPPTPNVVDTQKKLIERMENVNELLEWLQPPREPLSFEEALRRVEVWQRLGVPTKDIESMFLRARKRDVGAPARKRHLYISAFELQLRSEKMSLGKATRKLCPCGGKHEAKCEQRFKAGIRSLKKVLRRYAPELVSKYGILHPDRAEKVNG